MRKKRQNPRFLAPKPGAVLYLIIFLVSLIFTQALRSPASAILFIFLLFIPIISLIYIIIARAAIKVYTDSDVTRAGKGDPVEYEIKIINESPIPFPFVETIVSLPSENAVICRDELMRITLLPMGNHIIKSRVHFPLRGSYDIGVKYMYISDLFGLFRTEIKLELSRTIIVYPRKIAMAEDSMKSDTDLPTTVTKRTSSPEQAEQSDIRDYVPGDSMKSIHWKLSSKSEELQVKNWASNTDKHVYILLDLSFTGEKAKETLEEVKKARSAAEISKNKKNKRDKSVDGTGAARAKAAGESGDGAEDGERRGSALKSTEEKLASMGVTAEAIAQITADEGAGLSIEDGATRKGAKNARRITAERMAKLAVAVENASKKKEDITTFDPYDDSALPYAGELCTDAVIELALSSMRAEVMRGSYCTVLYPDSRMDSGIGMLTSDHDVAEDPSLLLLYTAPVCRNESAFGELAMMVEQSAGMTLQMVTANTDVYSAAILSSVPDALGGAGSGCSAEVLLANPEGIWKSEATRSAAAEAVSDELARSGIGVRRFNFDTGADGKLRFTSGL